MEPSETGGAVVVVVVVVVAAAAAVVEKGFDGPVGPSAAAGLDRREEDG